MSNEEMRRVSLEQPNFVYLDCGCWSDNAKGNKEIRRDFGLVCGSNVYLCEFVRPGKTPRRGWNNRFSNKNRSVQRLFDDLRKNGCNVTVNYYAQASNMDAKSYDDPSLYLFLGDLHMPPAPWFYGDDELYAITEEMEREPPDWIKNTEAYKRYSKDYLRRRQQITIGPRGLEQMPILEKDERILRRYYTKAAWDWKKPPKERHSAHGPIYGNPDIFRYAGDDLITFINGLSNASRETKELLHFIQTGDMFELWVGPIGKYQFREGKKYKADWEWEYKPEWAKGQKSIDLVSNWMLEIIIQNTPVFEAFRHLQDAGLKEVKFLWGNHDSYLMYEEPLKQVTDRLMRDKRDPIYRGLNGDLYAEHGHRFDRSNFDNVGRWPGPAVTELTYLVPHLRNAEPWARGITSIGHPKDLDCYLLGATLIYLNLKYDKKEKPFSIYVMAHTHTLDDNLFTYNIKTQYRNEEQP